jgi:hypothetical protein
VAAVAAVSAGVSAGATPPVSAAGNLAAITHSGAVHAASHAGTLGFDAASGTAPSRQATPDAVQAHRPHHPPARAQLASRQTLRQQAAGQHPARSQHQAAAMPAKPAAPYLIYDSVLPTAIPANNMIATYATGPYAASPSQVAGRGPVMWIDVYGTDYEASALDVEPSDATPTDAANWAWHRLTAHPNALAHIYTSLSEWPAVQAAVATLPAWMRAHIRWWIADPTGSPHIVPGSDATQWYWGQTYDITTASPRF